MQIKFLGVTESDDRIVEIPDGTQDVVEVAQAGQETERPIWPAILVIHSFLLTCVLITWMISNG